MPSIVRNATMDRYFENEDGHGVVYRMDLWIDFNEGIDVQK